MTRRTLSRAIMINTIMSIKPVAVGAISVVVVSGSIWSVLSALGAVVASSTIALGGKPGMWTTIFFDFKVVDNPSYALVGFNFLFYTWTTICMATLWLYLLSCIGSYVISIVRKDVHS